MRRADEFMTTPESLRARIAVAMAAIARKNWPRDSDEFRRQNYPEAIIDLCEELIEAQALNRCLDKVNEELLAAKAEIERHANCPDGSTELRAAEERRKSSDEASVMRGRDPQRTADDDSQDADARQSPPHK